MVNTKLMVITVASFVFPTISKILNNAKFAAVIYDYQNPIVINKLNFFVRSQDAQSMSFGV